MDPTAALTEAHRPARTPAGLPPVPDGIPCGSARATPQGRSGGDRYRAAAAARGHGIPARMAPA